MSSHLDRFDQNIARVDNLCNLFETVKESKKRPTVKEGDILRAAVVFLHSALENYLRSTIAYLSPHQKIVPKSFIWERYLNFLRKKFPI